MSASPLNLHATASRASCDPPAPETGSSGGKPSTHFADVMNAALAGRGDIDQTKADATPRGNVQDEFGTTKPAATGSSTRNRSDTDTEASAPADHVPVEQEEHADDSTVTSDTLAEAAAALAQPVVTTTSQIVPSLVAAPANDGQTVAAIPVNGSGTQISNDTALPVQSGEEQGRTNAGKAVPTATAGQTAGKDNVAVSTAKDVAQTIQDLKPPVVAPPTLTVGTSPRAPADTAEAAMPKNSSALPDPNGISTAKHMVQMNNMAETSKSPGLTEQNLPVGSTPVAGEELPVVVEKRTFTARTERAESQVLPTAAASPRVSAPDAGAPAEQVTASHLVTSSATVERTVQIIAQNAVQLRELGSDSLQVVIKPGGDLQLSLSLQQRDGAVQVQATLQNGDFNFLKQHWSELQQQLENRGIRLSSLMAEGQSQNNNQSQQQTSARRDEESASPAGGGSLGFATALAAPEIKAPTARSGRGWESWA